MKCLRRRLAWCNHTKSTYDSSEEQYSVLPRALADENGNPHKASQSNWSDKLESRYQSGVFMKFPPWVPQVAIVNAMFMVNTRPLRRTKTII